jgi:hypothetical protein
MYRIVTDTNPPIPLGLQISLELQDFLNLCFVKDPSARSSAAQLIDHPWLQAFLSKSRRQSITETVSPSVPESSSHTQIKFTEQNNVSSKADNDQSARSGDEFSIKKSRSFDDLKHTLKERPSWGRAISSTSGKKSGLLEKEGLSPEVIDRAKSGSNDSHNRQNESQGITGIGYDKEPVDIWLPAIEDELAENTIKMSLSSKSSPSMTSLPKNIPHGFGERNRNSTSSGMRISSLSSMYAFALRCICVITWQLLSGDNLNASGSDSGVLPKDRIWSSDDSERRFGDFDQHNHSSEQSIQARYTESYDMVDELLRNRRFGEGDFDNELNILKSANTYRVLEESTGMSMSSKFRMSAEDEVIVSKQSKELNKLMMRVRKEQSVLEVVSLCDQIIHVFDLNRYQKRHFVQTQGVMPILDMLETESRLTGSSKQQTKKKGMNASVSNDTMPDFESISPHILRIVNKIIEDDADTQEQLALVGIIPIIIRLFEIGKQLSYIGPDVTPLERLRQNLSMMTYFNQPGNISPAASFYNSNSSMSQSPSPALTMLSTAHTYMPVKQQSLMPSLNIRLGIANNDLDLNLMQAAKFFHNICSTFPAKALQMFISSGGLPILVSMISISSWMSRDVNSSTDKASLRASIISNLRKSPRNSSADRPVSPSEESLPFSQSQNKLTLKLGIPIMFASDDAKQVVYYGIDCIMQVFSLQSAKTRDLCRIFVRLGLLPHLALAFSYLLSLYQNSAPSVYSSTFQRPSHLRSVSLQTSDTSNSGSLHDILQQSTSSETAPSSDVTINNSSAPQDSIDFRDSLKFSSSNRGSFNTGSRKGHVRRTSESSDISSINYDTVVAASAGEGTEYKYAYCIATLFALFSKVDASVAEHMSREGGVLVTIMSILQSPGLRASSASTISIGQSPSKAHYMNREYLTGRRHGQIQLSQSKTVLSK